MRRIALTGLLLIAALAVLAGCTPSVRPPAPAGPSGARGISEIDGGPLHLDKRGKPIAAGPWANPGTIVVHEGDESGRVVASVQTSQDGKFSIDLPPGSYRLVLRGNGAVRLATVRPGEYATVHFIVHAL